MAQLSKARQLREQRKKLSLDALELANKPNNTAEERTAADKMLADADALKVQIDQLERADIAAAEFRNNGAPPASQPGGSDPQSDKAAQEKYHQAYINYLKYGEQRHMRGGNLIRGVSAEDRALLYQGSKRMNVALSQEDQDAIQAELRSMGAVRESRDFGTGGQGAYPGATTGFFVPVGFVNRIEEALKYYGPMLFGGENNPEIIETATGQPLPFPTDNDTTVMGELIGEGQQVTTADVNISQIVFGAYKFSTKLVKVSIELLQDSAFDLESYLVKKFGIRLGRILNNKFTVGTGTNEPKGIVTGAVAGPDAVGANPNDGSGAGKNTIGSDDLVELEHAVDILYRPGAKFMFHDSTLKALKKLKDKYGRPLWLPGVASDAPDTIQGYEYLINNDMASLQLNPSSPPVVNKTTLFGAMSKYTIRRVKEMSVLRLEERFADYGQVAFLAFARYDGQTLDAGVGPIRYMTNTY